jgi:hypothetical protein
MPTDRSEKITYDAPVAWIDLAAFGDDGEPYVIWPFRDCLLWHAKVIVDDEGHVLVRDGTPWAASISMSC